MAVDGFRPPPGLNRVKNVLSCSCEDKFSFHYIKTKVVGFRPIHYVFISGIKFLVIYLQPY